MIEPRKGVQEQRACDLRGRSLVYEQFADKGRGAGWLPGLAARGWSNRLGWYEGFHLLLAVNPIGVITGFGFGPASAKDQPLAETFFALRRYPYLGLPSVGAPASGPYVVDKGFEGPAKQMAWWRAYGAQGICPPKRNSRATLAQATPALGGWSAPNRGDRV